MDGFGHTDRRTGKSECAVEVRPVGEYIVEDLDRLGMTREQLADAIGHGPGVLDAIIAGHIVILDGLSRKLGEALGHDAMHFMNIDTANRMPGLRSTDR